MRLTAEPEERRGPSGWFIFVVRVLASIFLLPLVVATLVCISRYLFFVSFGGQGAEESDPWDLWMAHYLVIPTTILASILYGLLSPARGEPIRFASWGTARPVIGFAIGATAFWLFLALFYGFW